MNFGVIDIGSNTLKLNVYELVNKDIICVKKTVRRGALASYRENGCLSDKGKSVLVSLLSELKGECDGPVYPYATASLRGLEGLVELISSVREKTGLEIDVISGEDEARYGFYSFRTTHPTARGGVYMDMGGASTEAVGFDTEPYFLSSMPFGALKLKLRFCNGSIPDRSEERRIREFVRRCAIECGFDRCKGEIYATGGTARSISELCGESFGERSANDPDCIPALIDIFRADPEKTKEMLYNRYPDRHDCLLAGIIAYSELTRCISSPKIVFSPASAREGYAMAIAERRHIK